jgi:hypothetical protein
MSILTSVSKVSGVSFAELSRMDVYDFFVLFEVSDEQKKA